jgi:hypothetical protein
VSNALAFKCERGIGSITTGSALVSPLENRGATVLTSSIAAVEVHREGVTNYRKFTYYITIGRGDRFSVDNCPHSQGFPQQVGDISGSVQTALQVPSIVKSRGRIAGQLSGNT